MIGRRQRILGRNNIATVMRWSRCAVVRTIVLLVLVVTKTTTTTTWMVHADLSSTTTTSSDSSSRNSSTLHPSDADDTVPIVLAESIYQNNNDHDHDNNNIAAVKTLSDDFDEILRIPKDEDSSESPHTTSTSRHITGSRRSQYMHQQLLQIVIDNHMSSSSLQLIIHPNGKSSCQKTSTSLTIVPSDLERDDDDDDDDDDDSSSFASSPNATTTATSTSSSSSSSSSWVSDKYQMEATLTEYIASRWNDNDNNEGDSDSDADADCWSSRTRTVMNDNVHPNTEEEKENGNHRHHDALFYHYCDMGTNYTVIQKDYPQLVRVGNDNGNGNTSSSNDDDTMKPTYLPCRFYTREGIRIVSIPHLQSIILDRQQQVLADTKVKVMKEDMTECLPTSNGIIMDIDGTTATDISESPSMMECPTSTTATNSMLDFHIYAVPAGRVFMFAPKYVGEIFTLSHIVLPKPPTTTETTTTTPTMNDGAVDVDTPPDVPRVVISKNMSVVSLEVLSVVPPIFDIHHFFSMAESEQLITKALAEQSETYRFHRSTTGTSTSNVYSQRTSEVRNIRVWCTTGFPSFPRIILT